MNYLAHLYLAEQSREGLLGSLLGDFVKGRIGNEFTPGVRRGIRLHRRIDAFTDAHPVHLQSRNRMSASRRRFAGIIVDVCYDHFLGAQWDEFSSESLEAFSARVYDVLLTDRDALPERLQRIAPRMADEDWLGSYARLDNVGRTLDGISRRLRRENRLAGALVEVERNYADLAADFRAFFPELIAHAERLRADT